MVGFGCLDDLPSQDSSLDANEAIDNSIAPSSSSPKRTRSSSTRIRPVPGRSMPTSIFIRSEQEINQASSSPPKQPHLESSTFGVKSLSDTISSTGSSSPPDDHLDYADHGSVTLKQLHAAVLDHSSGSLPSEPPSPTSARSSPSYPRPRETSYASLAGPLIPFHLHSPVATTDSASASSPRTESLRSLRLSDEEDEAEAEDATSQAIVSSEEEEPDSTEGDQSSVFPQLVMPSIRMPARRPFTQNGKLIGKLKIMVAGPNGVGKSSLIRSIVQSCEDIVHVDPTSDAFSSRGSFGRTSSNRAASRPGFGRVVEISASTRAYPTWWSDLDDSRVLRRRRSSMTESVLERNICFIDTPSMDGASPVIAYIEHLLNQTRSIASWSDGELLGILGGNGGPQVDLVLYMLTDEPSSEDLTHLRSLSELTNVIPVLAKVDSIDEETTTAKRIAIQERLRSSEIKLAILDSDSQAHSSAGQPVVWAVSSAAKRDDEVMDASLLMSSEYIQPLVSSDLANLVETIFQPDSAAWLRHSSAKKFLEWRKHSVIPAEYLRKPDTANLNKAANTHGNWSKISSHSPSEILGHDSNTFYNLPTTASPYTLARLRDHTQNEERQAQVHLLRWASDLQRSLRSERERFENLQRNEQREWLMKKWDESGVDHEKQVVPQRASRFDPGDPLGLLAWDEKVRKRGLLLAKVIGSCGMLGAVLVFVMRTWGSRMDMSNPEGMWDPAWIGG